MDSSGDPEDISVHSAGAFDLIVGDLEPDEAFVTVALAPGVLEGVVALVRLGWVVMVASHHDAVVDVALAVDIISADDTAAVELEGSAGVHSHREGSLKELSLDSISVTTIEVAPALRSLSDDVLWVMFARLIPLGVRIELFSHNSLVLLELPGTGHPATLAATLTVGSSKEVLILLGVACAVDKLLLRDITPSLATLGTDSALKGRVSSECPA